MARRQDYQASGHRIQTAIAVLMGRDPSYRDTEPKHMRVGLDLSKSDQAGLARLLIAKGVFTEAEYVEAITKTADEEANSHERRVQAFLAIPTIKTG